MSLTYNNMDICLGEEVICRSYGPTPVITVASGSGISINPTHGGPYKITRALQGTLLKLYMLHKEFADGNEWFMHGDHAYYLSTSRYINGWSLNWKSKRNFGELLLDIVTREQIIALNPVYAYTLFLRHNENNILAVPHENYVEVSEIWDRVNDKFLEEFPIPDGFRGQDVVESGRRITDGIDYDSNELVIVGNNGQPVHSLVPLMVTFYEGDHLVSLKYEDIDLNNLVSIRSLNANVAYSAVLAYWLGYPGLDEYCTHFLLGDKFWKDYYTSMSRFNHALVERYHGKFYTFPRSMYKCGIERLIENASSYTLDQFQEKGYQILLSAVKNYNNRANVVYEFMTF